MFHDSDLGHHMLGISRELESEGVYLVGDSAYALRNYLMTPYDNAAPGTAEDTFNFYQSSCRIWVECAFGEIDRRWGIFWKRLEGDLRNHKYTIDSAMRLHNFIIDYREAAVSEFDMDTYREEMQLEDELDTSCDLFMEQNPFATVGVLSEEVDEVRQRGRPTNEQKRARDAGVRLRDNIRDRLEDSGLLRPTGAHCSARNRFNRPTNIE